MGFVRDLTGKTAADAARKGGDAQVDQSRMALEELRASKEQGLGFLQPFQQLGQQGLDQASFLTDPQAQFDFLQNNPLFQMGLDNANTQTNQMAASRGRLSAGDTLQQLNNNALLTAAPLIGQQKQSIQDLLSRGFNTGQSQANASLGFGSQLGEAQNNIGNSIAGNLSGQASARGAAANNMLGLASGIASNPAVQGFAKSLFSDPRLKENIKQAGVDNGFNIYSWDWNEEANKLNLYGSSKGVMADEVNKTRPEAITIKNGYMQVDYAKIGVKH
tara:strand:+ start:969 stop:1793 length:825 start_codon:yes stop_codon:yes gene_type:complete